MSGHCSGCVLEGWPCTLALYSFGFVRARGTGTAPVSDQHQHPMMLGSPADPRRGCQSAEDDITDGAAESKTRICQGRGSRQLGRVRQITNHVCAAPCE